MSFKRKLSLIYQPQVQVFDKLNLSIITNWCVFISAY